MGTFKIQGQDTIHHVLDAALAAGYRSFGESLTGASLNLCWSVSVYTYVVSHNLFGSKFLVSDGLFSVT